MTCLDVNLLEILPQDSVAIDNQRHNPIPHLGFDAGKVVPKAVEVRRFHPQIRLRGHCVRKLRHRFLDAEALEGGKSRGHISHGLQDLKVLVDALLHIRVPDFDRHTPELTVHLQSGSVHLLSRS